MVTPGEIPIPENFDNINTVRLALTMFVTDVCQLLKRLVIQNELPIDEVFSDNESELNTILIAAFNDLKIDEEGNASRLLEIKDRINGLDRGSLESVGLIGNNLKIKIYVYAKLRSRLLNFLGKVKSGAIKFFHKVKEVSDSIFDSLGKLITLLPLLDPITEFKDIYSNTRKSIED